MSPKSSNQHYTTSSNITQHQPPNITWPYPISSNIIQPTLCNVSQYYPTDIIQYHPTSPNQHYTTSSNITTQHHSVSSNITDHQPPLSSSAQLHWTLSNITWYQPTSIVPLYFLSIQLNSEVTRVLSCRMFLLTSWVKKEIGQYGYPSLH